MLLLFDIDLILNLYKEGTIDTNLIVVNNGYKTTDYLKKIISLYDIGFENVMVVLDNKPELERLTKLLEGTNKKIKIGLIFEQNENIPERLKKDPAGLLDYANSAESREKLKQKVTEKDSGASTIVGATKEDMAELGMETTGRSLNEIAKEKGTLSMKDLMDMSGS